MTGGRAEKVTARLVDLAIAVAVCGAVFGAMTLIAALMIGPRQLPAFFVLSLIAPALVAIHEQADLPRTIGLLAAFVVSFIPARRALRLPLMIATLGLWIVHGARMALEIAAV